MYWFKEAFLLGAFIFFVSLITSMRCDSYINAIEGESVQLDFPYPCDSLNITLQYGNRRPFYNSAKTEFMEVNLDEPNGLTLENTNQEGNCFLQLRIHILKRTDGGIYSLLAYNGDYIRRLSLHVDFLPGVAYCSFGGSNDYTGDWEKLNCKATVGSMLGQIQCYQRGMRMPHLDEPSENDKTLQQTILVQQNRHYAYCCSSQLIEPKERCDCYDVVWDPLSKGEVHNQEDPCPTTTHLPTVPQTTYYHHDHSSPTMRALIPNKGEIKEGTYPTNKSLIVLIITFAMLMVLFIIFIIYLSQSKHMRHRSNAKKAVAETASGHVAGVHV